MRRQTAYVIVLALMFLPALPSCARRAEVTSEPQPEVDPLIPGQQKNKIAQLRVDNRNFADMTIYVIRGGGTRIRIGQVSGNATTTMPIPASLVGGGAILRFMADPVGSNRTPISQEISVDPGDVVEMEIPPG